ncbi:hypothetical protein NC653_018287 [Populus alba x Populus x berolinensis]|uniref:Uncharacterized protein n=1 Tax=Populus alba x Populus x berolinensis TaxID=444605 RepID=A0AAD6QG39_9ROSI|nr:hypothetical protein NC653_018287 [Populus alba x Populus x berolinensis]
MATLEADEGDATLLKAGVETGKGDDNCCTRSLATDSGAKKTMATLEADKKAATLLKAAG